MAVSKASGAVSEKSINWTGLIHLFVVYIVWGSTYLAIRVAVRPGAGFPPFWLGALRLLAASLLLGAWAVISRQRLKPSRKDVIVLVASGLLLWLGGNGLLNWAEQRVDSGLAALIIGATPIWVALMEALLDRKLPSPLLAGSLLIGFSGIALLTAPTLFSGVQANIFSILVVLFAALSWGGGTLLQSRRPIDMPPATSSAYQQFIGGISQLAVALLISEPRPTPTTSAWLAWVYLVIFGSVLAFTSFIQAVKLLPINIVMTYPFVNPVIAVLLGRVILSEPLTWWTVAGAGLTLLGVAGVFRSRYRRRT
jgi:drug/metabolite transporter (DMT)-like permease